MRGMIAECERCGEQFVMADEREGNRRLAAGLRCECGGRYTRGRFTGRPTPVEIYRRLLAVVEAEIRGDMVQRAVAEALWEESRSLLAAGVRLRAELEKESA